MGFGVESFTLSGLRVLQPRSQYSQGLATATSHRARRARSELGVVATHATMVIETPAQFTRIPRGPHSPQSGIVISRNSI